MLNNLFGKSRGQLRSLGCQVGQYNLPSHDAACTGQNGLGERVYVAMQQFIVGAGVAKNAVMHGHIAVAWEMLKCAAATAGFNTLRKCSAQTGRQ